MIEFIDLIKHRKICNSGEYRLDLTADFGVKTSTNLVPNCQLRKKSKTGFKRCLYTVILTSIFA